jgi:tetratricopeptide (TPR) repeat protein
MRRTSCIAAALLLPAFVVTGCSKREETSQSKVGSTDVAVAKPVATSGESVTVPPVGNSGVPATANVPQPMTFAEGKAAYDARKYQDAAAIFERYAGRRPGNAWGQYMLGMSAWKSGDLSKAESAFEKALTVDPRHVKSSINLSRVLIEQKRYDDAAERLTRVTEVEPSSNEVYRLLGRTYHAQGKTDEAMDAYRRAIELNELDAWSTNNLGLVLFEQQRTEEALPLFEKAVELRQETAAFHNNLGMALEHVGRFRDAATAYTGALLADPGYEKAKQNLTRVEAIKVSGDEKTPSK